jgi:hypothetical protein
MTRRVTSGRSGGTSVAGLQAISTTLTSADNLDITIDPTGTGRVLIAGDMQLQTQSDLRFADADSSNWIALQAPETIPANYTLTFPSAVSSISGYALISDTNGNLSWGASGASLVNNNTDSGVNYVTFTTQTDGFLTNARVSSSTRPMTYQPSTGTFTVTNIVESSSITLKENIVPIENALDSILKLKGVTYDRIDGSSKGEAGLIAEWVNTVLPNLVTKDENNNPIGINYTKLSAYLIESVKTLKEEINGLKGVK